MVLQHYCVYFVCIAFQQLCFLWCALCRFSERGTKINISDFGRTHLIC